MECESCFYARCGPFSEGRGDEALALARRLRDRLRDYPGWFSFICPDCTVHRGEHEADCAVAELMRDTAADLAEAKRVLDPAKEVDRG